MSAAPAVDAPTVVIKSVYAHLDCLLEGIEALKKAGYRNIVVTSPLPRHEIEEMIYEGEPSPVRWFTLCGALFGGISGFMVCSMMALNWPMIMPAGKPLVSIPPYLVITFEATVLWGCFATLIGMLVCGRLPADDLQVEVTDPRFSDDVFGLIVNGLGSEDTDTVHGILSQTGAYEVDGQEVSNG
jgi:molybdopterin-containing oxidoreductase family membrane subunit